MRRVCLLVLLLPLAGCEVFDDYLAYSEPNSNNSCGVRPSPVRACGDGPILQTGAQLPAQTIEPPR